MLSLDRQLFLAVNGLQGNHLADRFFLAVTDLGSFWLAATLPLLLLFVLHRRKALRPVLCALVLGLPLAFVSHFAKTRVGRLRPSVSVVGAKVFGPHLENFSFPSGHALTVFAVFGFLWVMDRRLAYVWLPVAVLVCLSRVYLGVHFPSDVLAGAAIGFALAFLPAKWLKLTIWQPRQWPSQQKLEGM